MATYLIISISDMIFFFLHFLTFYCKSRVLKLIHYFFSFFADIARFSLGIRFVEKQIQKQTKLCSPPCSSPEPWCSTSATTPDFLPVQSPNQWQLRINSAFPPRSVSFAFHCLLVSSSQGWKGPQHPKSLQRVSPAQR